MREEYDEAAPMGFPPDTVMDQPQLALALRVHVQTIIRAGVPASYALGSKTPRYIWGDVIAWLREHSRSAA